MIYNHGYAKAEWQREENNRVEEMRQHGMSETDIQIMIDFDLAVFNSDRSYGLFSAEHRSHAGRKAV